MTISKDKFREVATGAIASLTSMFDDIWETGYPKAIITMKSETDGSRVRVVVGIEEVYDGEDRDDS